jgi:PilZ domain
MLDISHEKSVVEKDRVEELWQQAKIRVKLPMLTSKYFFEPKGPMPNHYSSRRSFHRYFMRSKAVLIQGDKVYAAYTTDVSRQGVGFLSPKQLMPKEKWTVKLPNGSEYELIVTRCHLESESCFACGGRFDTQGNNPTSINEETP